MSTEILEHEPNYKMPVVYFGMDIPDVVEMTKWRDGCDIITTYRDSERYWHFRKRIEHHAQNKEM